MPSFTKGPAYRTPFGKNAYLRSTKDIKPESRTCAASTITAETIDGATSQKILQSGQVMAKITSGPEIGKVGPYAGATDNASEVQTLTRTSTGGTVTLTFDGETTGTIAATAAGFTAAAVQAALEATAAFAPGGVDVAVTGAAGGPLTVTFKGQYANTNVAQITVDNTSATGGTVTAATLTAGSAGTNGATDGRGSTANIVGINDTFLPWQLMDRDVEIAVVYQATVYQARCFEYNAAGARIPLSDATAAAMRSGKGLSILFK